MTLPSPIEIGAPAKFTAWRPNQESALMYPLESDERFTLQGMPTGFGKSVTVVGRALLTARRTCILTVTKGLQQQYVEDLREAGLVDIRGQNSYGCVALARGDFGDPVKAGCDEGPCHFGVRCRHRDDECLYFAAYHNAIGSKLVVTNYAYWLNINAYNEEGLGEFDELIMDEAHDAVNQLSSFLAIEFERFECEAVLKMRMPGPNIEEWREWAKVAKPRAEGLLDIAKEDAKDRAEEGARLSGELRRALKMLSLLINKLGKVISMRGDWLAVPQRNKTKLEPIWPAPYAEEYLFRGIERVNLISATLRPKTAELLGIKSYDFKEYPSSFPVKRRPVIHVPTVKVRFGWSVEDKKKWIARMDEIIGARLDRKGIIHTVSYQRQEEVITMSRYAELMLVNKAGNTLGVVERFKEADAPKLLVSPSLSTGWDFPFAECEYQIISKIPFPDKSDPVIKARSESDPEYAGYIAMLTLVQSAGRGMRDAKDQCEIFIIDDNWWWFFRDFGKFAPAWFRNAVKRSKEVPFPPPPLG